MLAERAVPPAFRYEKRAVEDRKASMEAGAPVYVDEDWVIVTQRGSRDEIEFPAAQWLEQMERASRERSKDMPGQWVRDFKEIYEKWKRGEELTVKGFALKNWPAITPAEAKNCARIGIHSVEEVAAMSESEMQMFGLGGRGLKQKAKDFLAARESNGTAQELSSLRSENEALKQLVDEMQRNQQTMRAQLDALAEQPAKRGRN